MSDTEHELGDVSDLADGQMRVFEDAGDYGIVVCRVKGELYALEDNCSHADTPLSEGRLRNHSLTCPLHGTSFDVRTGEHSGPPAYEGVPCFRVEERDGTAVAIGASAATDRPVIGVTGDGGFLFTATELATAVQHNIPCNIVLFNNNAYGNVRRIQRERFGEDRTIASKLTNPDFAKMADAFGVKYWHADSPETFRPALGESIEHDGPCLVEVTVDAMPNPWPYLRMPANRGERT